MIDDELLCQADAWYWAAHNKIQLQGGVYTLRGHPWQVEPMQSTAQRRCARKAAQMGWSELEVLRTIHGLIHGLYQKGVLYLFPTTTDVADFSRVRFAPLISQNPEIIGKHVTDTDSISIKKIGGGVLYLRGARLTSKIAGVKKDSGRLKTIPVDKIVLDERDLIDDAAQDLARERMSHSDVQEEVSFSTPTLPDYGVDREYQESNQKIWMIKCQHCNTETCLELEFPECVQDGKNVCIKCGQEIYSKNGRWVAQFPDKEIDGYWISQLNSPFIKPALILDMYRKPPHGNLAEVYNSKLGMAYINAEDRLTPMQVWACCNQESMYANSIGSTAMGVDIGKDLHVVIGQRVNKKQYRILKVATLSTFNDLHDIAKRFRVKKAVLDAFPETRKAREFQANTLFQVYLCEYQHTISNVLWNDKTGIVKVNRTEICDGTHELFEEVGTCEIPRRCTEIDVYAKQMCNIAKTLEVDEETGSKAYRYIRRFGPDHYRHATNYFLMAASEMSFARKDRGHAVNFKNWGNK